MKKLTMLLLMLLVSPTWADIYKWVDSAGNVYYGDQPETSKAKRMKDLPGLSTYDPPPIPEAREEEKDKADEGDAEQQANDGAQGESQQVFSYRELSIISPDDGGVVRSSPGNVSVFVALAPVLRKGDYLKVILDGKVLEKKYYSTVMQLETVDRGMHQLAVAVYDKTGKQLLQSQSVSFQLHRTIARQRQPRG